MSVALDPELPLVLDGRRVDATVTSVEDDHVVVELEGGHLAHLPLGDFRVAQSDAPRVEVGDRFDVHVEHLSNDGTHWVASRDKVVRLAAFESVLAAFRAGRPVEGEIVGPVEGGYAVDVGIRAFLPGSQVALRPVRRNEDVLGQRLTFKIIRFDKNRQNVVVSRRALLEAEQDERFSRLKVGAVVDGTVRSFAEYGAFIDIGGGVEGLLHIAEMSWTKIRRPQEAVKKGEKITVKVIQLEPDKKRISFSLRQLQDDPWLTVQQKYPVGARVSGLVVSKTDFGCFLEVERGLEGLVHSTGALVAPGDAARMRRIDVGDEIEARIVDLDPMSRRMSLVLARED